MSSSYQVNYTGAQVDAAIEKALELYTNSQIDNFLLQKVDTAITINGKALTDNITLTASDVGALPSNTVIPSKVSDLTNDSGFISSVAWGDVTGKPSTFTPASHNQASSTINALTNYSKTVTGGTGALATSDTLNKALAKLENALDGKQASGSYAEASHTHTKSEITDFPTIPTVNNKTITIQKNGTAVDSFTLNQSSNKTINITVPTKVSDLTNDAGYTTNTGTITGIKMNGASKGTSGVVDLGTVITSQYVHPTTAGNKHVPSGGSSGQFLKWSADGTATWAADNDTKNTAGSTDTSSKIFLVGATSQAANPQTYSHDTAFVDTNGRVNSAAPASDANDTTVATTKWVKDQSYVTTNTTQTISGTKTFTGTPVFSNDAIGAQLTVNRSNNASGYSVIRYTNNGTVKGYLGVHYEGRPIWGNSSGTYYNLVRNSALDTAVGSATKGVYISSSGVATAMTYSLNKDVPSNAVFTDTKNTAGSTDTSSKIFLVGATSQAANPQTYSHDTVFVDTNGALNSATPTAGNNSTKVATTAFVTTAIGSYVKKAGDTMTGALNFANGTWNKMGDDAYIGDHNIGGHICIKPVNSAHDNDGGITFFNSSDTQLVALKASSGTLTSSGALGVSNNAAKMQYNATTEAIEFVFA